MLNGGELDRRNASCILWNCADRNKLLRCTDHQPKQNDGQRHHCNCDHASVWDDGSGCADQQCGTPESHHLCIKDAQLRPHVRLFYSCSASAIWKRIASRLPAS
jgi:hypothetical protein